MLFKKARRQDADTLTWEYLDGEISPTRAQVLSSMLRTRAEARERFVESAVMHGMLFDYFKREAANRTDEQTEQPQADAQVERRQRPRRRRLGRTSAA